MDIPQINLQQKGIKINYIGHYKEIIKLLNKFGLNQRIIKNRQMGSIISEQLSQQVSQQSQSSTMKVNKNWRVLQKGLKREILQSKKTDLIVERYCFQIQHHEDLQSENKLYEWRNSNPNSESMVNVLSVSKEQFGTQNTPVECGTLSWCPSKTALNKIYVVTERILRLDELGEFLKAKKEVESHLEKNRVNSLYATEEIKTYLHEVHKKFKPFLEMAITPKLLVQLLKDWLRGIEVLCYKFGYFKVGPQLLGITIHMRGTVWITSNYALNHLSSNEKIQVSTAEQKFKYENDTIQQILKSIQKIQAWKTVIPILQNNHRFQQVLKAGQKYDSGLKKVHKKQKKTKNESLIVEHGSFLNSQNISILRFDNSSYLQTLESDKKAILQQRFPLISSSNMNSRMMVSSSSSKSITKKSMKRSNTGEKSILINLSPQNKQSTQGFINSGHKYGGRQTAPTNQLGQSLSLQSVNHPSQRGNIENVNITKNVEKPLLVKSQNVEIPPIGSSERKAFEQKFQANSHNKVYYPNHMQKNYFSCEPHIFRSHANYSMDINYKSPRIPTTDRVSPLPYQKYSPRQNYSLDEMNMIGPYRTEHIYSNLRKQKIALVDSMVMVHQQSEQIEQQLMNGEKPRIIMQQSIIIRGNQEEAILPQSYE